MPNSPEFQTVEFGQSGAAIRICSGIGILSFKLMNPQSCLPGKIKLEIDRHPQFLPEFANRGGMTPHGTYTAEIYCVLFASTVIVVGWQSVVSITTDSPLENVLSLNRKPTDDAGFYETPKLLIAGQWVLLKYEGGLICFDRTGKLRWHQELFYDDILEGYDDKVIFFSNEHFKDGCRWGINLKSGNRLI